MPQMCNQTPKEVLDRLDVALQGMEKVLSEIRDDMVPGPIVGQHVGTESEIYTIRDRCNKRNDGDCIYPNCQCFTP